MNRTTAVLGCAALLLLAACSDSKQVVAPSASTNASTTSGMEPSTTAATDGARYVEDVFPNTESRLGLLYATAPDLQTGAATELHLDVYSPADDPLTARPAIVWVHGGGFKAGNRNATTAAATAWAQRGYVTISIDYRLDTGSRCQEVQDKRFTGVEMGTERDRFLAAILAAQHDTQAAIRWVRANATDLGVDPDRIAIGGFSAGAVTAVNVATRSDDPGAVGDHLDQPSTVSAALVASGCSFNPDDIGSGDSPMFLIASENDQAVPFECITATADAAEAAGVAVETMYYFGEGTHAKALYEKYLAEVEPAWGVFLVEHLGLG